MIATEHQQHRVPEIIKEIKGIIKEIIEGIQEIIPHITFKDL